ncbi:MAG: hypothetical protein JXR97_12120, partial [Planctomycetes bacterium]|nr:hypothetical protein [Planctomycetota bacterium]
MRYAPIPITADVTEPVPVILYSREAEKEARQVMRNLQVRGIRAKAVEVTSAAQLAGAMRLLGARGAVFYLALRGKGGRVELPGDRRRVDLPELLGL